MRDSGSALFARNAAMVVAALAAIASALGMQSEPPTHEDYSNVAKKNVVTLPAGVVADVEASIDKADDIVIGGLDPGERPVYRWKSPETLKSAVWEGNWAGNVLAPGRVERVPLPTTGDRFHGEYIPQGYRGNLALLPAWVPPTLFPRADTLGESSEPLIPAAMFKTPTGWQGRKREVLNNTVDLMTGTPLIQVTDLKLPVGGATFQLTRTRSAMHGTTFPTIGSDNSHKFTYDATDRVWDWLGAGWMIGENPILLIDDTRADVVGDNPPTCWLILDAHHSIPFQWVEGIKRYEAPPRFRARLTYTVTADSGKPRLEQLDDDEPGDRVWEIPPTEIKISLYDNALVYTFAVVWEDVPKNTWRTGYLSEEDSDEWGESSLHDRPYLRERFEGSRPNHTPWDRSINPGLGIPYYALLTKIEDRNGVRVEINYTPFRQYSIDSPHSDVQEVMQEGHKKGQISYIQVYENDNTAAAWTLVYSHRTFLGIRQPYVIGGDIPYFIPEECDLNGVVTVESFFDHGARRQYPWDVDNGDIPDRASIHGYSAIDRIYVYKGNPIAQGTLQQLRLQSSAWDAEAIESADSIAALNEPLGRLNLNGTDAELFNWDYAIRYDYHRGVPEPISYDGYNRDAYKAFEGWWAQLQFDGQEDFDPAAYKAEAPTSPPMLLLTTVFERKDETAPPAPFKRRGIIYNRDSEHVYAFGNQDPYRVHYSIDGGGAGSAAGLAMLPWIDAILEDADIARLAQVVDTGDPTLHELLLNYRFMGAGVQSITEQERNLALDCASIRFDQANMGIPESGAGNNSAPSLSALWTSPSSSEYPGPYIRSGGESQQVDLRAYWDGHWATVGVVSSKSGSSNAEFHARVHRFIRRPIEITGSAASRSYFAFPGQTHQPDSAPMASVFLSPFQWHAYRGVDIANILDDALEPALVAPPDGVALGQPRVIVVVDEFASREKMLADVAYSSGEEGALKDGMVARTVYELNPWGYLLRKRRWEFNDGGFQVQTEGIGEEYIYSTVSQIAAANGLVLPTEEHLAPPSGFADELLLTEYRSLGWSVADQQLSSNGDSEGLVEFYDYSLAIPSTEQQLESLGWPDRVQLTAKGVQKGNGSESPKYYTHQYFYGNGNMPNVPTAIVRFNQETTSRLTSAPQLSSGGGSAPDPAFSVEFIVDAYANPNITPGEQPSMRTRIAPPLQQRPGGDWYFPIEIECKDGLGQPTWTASGLVRNPLNPGVDGPDPFETLTWTCYEIGAFGLPKAIVVDVDPPEFGSQGQPISYDQPELGPNPSILVGTFVQRCINANSYIYGLPPRIANDYSGPPLQRLTVYGYDGEGNLTDIIEPERRWARRVVTDFGPPGSNGENLDPLDDMTYEYTFAGLTSYQDQGQGAVNGTYECRDGGTIGIHYGNKIAGQPAETLHVRYLNRVPIVVTAANRPQGPTAYEPLRRTEYILDGSGRPIKSDQAVYIDGNWREEGGRAINDLGEVYRVFDYTGNVNRWTRNYLGMRFRRYEGTLDTYWDNEGYAIVGNGDLDHDFDQDHGVDFTGYDMVLKELNRFGESPRDIRQPVQHLRFLSDHRQSWAHTVDDNGTPYTSDDTGGYHNPPSPEHLASSAADAYLTVYGYDWSMRRVREDIHDLPAVGTQLQESDRQRTILHYFDYAGREAMTVVFGPLIPSDISVVDPALLGPDAVLPSVDEFLALNPRPLSITTRVFDNADRIVEAREYDVASPVGQEARFTRSLAYHGFKDQQVFTLDSGAPAVATYLDALGRPVVIAELTTSSTGNWSVELGREHLTLNDRGQVLQQVSWERVNSIGDTLGTTNAVSTTTWNWYDHSGRLTATAELGTGTASYLAPSQLPTGYDDVDAPQLTSPGLVVTIDSELASARVTIHEYNEAGRIVATRHPDGTIDTFAYEGARPLATTYNASATSSDLTRTTAQGRTDGKVTSIRAVDTLANIDTPLSPHGWMSQQFGAPVLDRDFQIQSFDRTRPSRMGRTFDVDPENPAAVSNFEFEFAYDFLGRLAQRTARDGTVTRYTYDVFDEIRTIEIGHLDAGQFTPGYPATSGIAAADRIGFVEFASTWSVGESKEPIEVRDIIARVARDDPAGGPGRVVSHVQQHFDGRGNLVREYQSIGAMVNSNTPCIDYEWECVTVTSSLDTGFSRLSAIKYPDFFASGRRTVNIDYGSPGSITNNFNLAHVVTTNVDAGSTPDLMEWNYESTARRSSSNAKSLRLDTHSGNATVVGFDRVDSFGDLAITAYESAGAYGPSTPLYTAQYHRDALARVVGVQTSYHASFNNTRSSGHRYDPLGRLAESAIGALSFSPGDPANWSMTTSYRADAWHMDRLDNWNSADPNNSALFGHVTVGNFDTDPAAETAFFHYDTTASSDLDLLMHGLDGSVDPPVQVQRDPLGRVLFDGIYFYGYDAWGRLTQINLAEPIGNDQYQQGELVRHFVYDGLGRTIRVQRAADSGFINDPGVSYVSSEFIFYDGMRRIADVLAAPVYDKYSALVTGGESGENQEETEQEAGHFVDGKTANTGFEHLELGDTTYLQVHREYVWDPDPDYSPFGGVDTLVAYFDGADRDKPWYVIQSQQGDPVAIVDCDLATQTASVVWRAAFEPYGSVVWASNATADSAPALAMGHKGLFVERLDAPPVVWFFNDDERLAPEADLLVLMRNRQYLPRLGRFLQPDPNATGVAVQPSLAYGGSALPTPDPYVDLNSWAADGTNPLAYAMSDPVNGADPTGLFWGGLIELALEGLDAAMAAKDNLELARFGLRTGFALQEATIHYGAFQEYDIEWATDWSADDAANTHSVAFMYGFGPWTDEDVAEGDDVSGSDPAVASSKLNGVTRSSYTARRSAWNSLRQKIWRNMADNAPKGMWTSADIKRMQRGLAPKGYVIHHIKPLSQGGRNNMSNLAIMRQGDHTGNFGSLHRVGRSRLPRTPGMGTTPTIPGAPVRWGPRGR